MHESVVSQNNLIDSDEASNDSGSQWLKLSLSNKVIFSRREDFISDGFNLFGQGPSLVGSAPAVYG